MLKPPKHPALNLEWRQRLLELGNTSKTARDEIKIACERDPIFFTDSFLLTFDPQHYADSPLRPLVTWPHQERALRRVCSAIGKHNMMFPKSRRMGVTTLTLAAFFWRWCFRPMQSFLLCSSKEDRVDKRGDPSSLMWKLDSMLECLPAWLRPPCDRASLRFANPANGSIINGESTNSDVDRGGVRTAVLADEVAAMSNANAVVNSISPLTQSLFLVSTPKGAFGAFYELYEKWRRESPDWIEILHWTMHPRFAEGLYFTNEALTGYVDPSWGGRKPRSPWYDRECKRMIGPKQIAQELDIAFNEAGGRYFEEELIARLLKGTRPPLHRGELEYEGEPRWLAGGTGRLLLWCPLDANGRPPPGTYVLGADIALGTGGEMSSQSAASIVNRDTGEKVGEFKYNRISPTQFARLCVALAKWFHGAKMIWGCQGPGVTFGQEVTSGCRYFNIFYREDETSTASTRTRKMGYSEIGESRVAMFGGYLDALHTGRFLNRSREALEECRQFIISSTGTIEHSKALQSDDPENRGKLHGDIVVSDALACRLLPDRKPKVDENRLPTGRPPRGSMAERHWDVLQNRKRIVYF